MRHPVAELDSLERRTRSRLPIRRADPCINERQLHIVQRRCARQQIERLEHEPDFLVPDPGQLVVVHLADLLAVEQVGPFRRRVQAANQVHECRFAGTRRPHDGDIVTALDVNRHAAQRVNLLGSHHVGLPQVARFNQRHSRVLRRGAADGFMRTSGGPAAT